MQKINESGRSMVEMLGVLAIIGLLSVGGIAGYIQAMNSHRTNETIQRLMRRAVVISGQRQLGQNASLAGFNENDGTYTMTLNEGASGNATTFTMGVSGVPEEVCTRIKNMDWKIATVSDDCATFTFNNDLTERSSESGSGEGSGDGTGTPEETKTPQQLCEEDSSKVWCDNGCYNAVFESDWGAETRMYSDDDGACACDAAYALHVWNHQCVDSNTKYKCLDILENCPYPLDGNGCYVSVEEDDFWPEEYYAEDDRRFLLGQCGFESDDITVDDPFYYFCPGDTIYDGSACVTCGEGYFVGRYASTTNPPEAPDDLHLSCVSCTTRITDGEKGSYKTSAHECAKCGNLRKMENGFCLYKDDELP